MTTANECTRPALAADAPARPPYMLELNLCRLVRQSIPITTDSTVGLTQREVGKQLWISLLVDGRYYDLVMWKHQAGPDEGSQEAHLNVFEALRQVQFACRVQAGKPTDWAKEFPYALGTDEALAPDAPALVGAPEPVEAPEQVGNPDSPYGTCSRLYCGATDSEPCAECPQAPAPAPEAPALVGAPEPDEAPAPYKLSWRAFVLDLLSVLTPERTPVAAVWKALRFTRGTLEALIAMHRNELAEAGVLFHTATTSQAAALRLFLTVDGRRVAAISHPAPAPASDPRLEAFRRLDWDELLAPAPAPEPVMTTEQQEDASWLIAQNLMNELCQPWVSSPAQTPEPATDTSLWPVELPEPAYWPVEALHDLVTAEDPAPAPEPYTPVCLYCGGPVASLGHDLCDGCDKERAARFGPIANVRLRRAAVADAPAPAPVDAPALVLDCDTWALLQSYCDKLAKWHEANTCGAPVARFAPSDIARDILRARLLAWAEGERARW